MEAYRFDEKIYIVGDAYVLRRFVTDDDGHSKEEKIYGILSEYKPNKLTFMTVDKGLIVYSADIQLNDLHIWSPKYRVDTLGNRYAITMSGLKANTDIIPLKPGVAYFIKTPVNWIKNDFYGIYTGWEREAEGLFDWPELKFITGTGEFNIKYVDVLRGNVKLCDLSDHSKEIEFREE